MVVLGGLAVAYERGTPVPLYLSLCERATLTAGTEAGSYLRLIDSCITQLKAQGPSRTCNESKEEEDAHRWFSSTSDNPISASNASFSSVPPPAPPDPNDPNQCEMTRISVR